MKFNYVSLFSGIGGFEQALNKLGGTCVMASEIDKFANQSYEVLYGHKTVGDVTKVSAEDVPDHDVLVGGFPCFAEGTLITTATGLKTIEEVRKGDKVLTHTNEFKPVVIPMVKRKKGIFEIKIQGSPSTLVTEEHPYYVREMVRVWDNEGRTNKRTFSEPKWVEAKDLHPTKHFVGFSENKNSNNPHNITMEDAWLLGRYVADGYILDSKRSNRKNSYNNQVVYCIGKAKLSEFKEKVESYKLGISEDRTVFKVRIIDTRLRELATLCGKGSENKEVPTFILDLPKEILAPFLDGYLSGDGSVKNGVYSATSVSRKLIYLLGQAVQKVYNTPYSITFTKRPTTTIIEGRTVNQRDTWTVRFSKEVRKQNNGIYIDGMLWMPVKAIRYDGSWEGNVYNFEVADDNSYVANNATVHNCQAFSVAGKRGGFDDARGTLFFEMARIAAEKQPKLLLAENVKGLVSHDKGKTLDTIVKTLNDIGYRVDFEILNSKYFGVPQNRERIFIVGIREDLVENEPWGENGVIAGTTVIPKGKRRLAEYPDLKSFNFDWPIQGEVTTRLRDILEPAVDERYYLSDEKTAQLVAKLDETERSNTPKCVHNIYGGFKESKPRVFEGESPTIRTSAGGGHLPSVLEEINGLPIREATTKGYAVAAEGDAVNIQFPNSKTRRGRVGRQVAQTLEASGVNQGVVTQGTYPRYRIRKLTPLECFRLQGFPDSTHQTIVDAGISDSQRYKQAGNAVTVSVVEAIGARLLTYL